MLQPLHDYVLLRKRKKKNYGKWNHFDKWKREIKACSCRKYWS